MIEGNVHQDRMKRRLQALSFNKQRHCFQFTFLATDRKTHEGHVSRDAGRTGDPAERRRRRGILKADRMFHVTDDSYTSSIKMKLIMKSFILQVISVL